MSCGKAIKNPGVWRKLKSVCAFLLLCTYVAGNAAFPILHEVFHSYASLVTHSPAQEKDSCHRAIYHFEKEQAWGHESHLTVKGNCDHCHALAHTDQIVVRSLSPAPVDHPLAAHQIFIATSLKDISFHLPSRAPPLS